MKIRFTEIENGKKIVHNKKYVNVGDIVELPKARAEHYVSQGQAEVVKEAPKTNSKE